MTAIERGDNSLAMDLASRWHGRGRARYAVTPRFSLSASDPMLASCAAVMADVDGRADGKRVSGRVRDALARG